MKFFKFGLISVCLLLTFNLYAQNRSAYLNALNYIANDNRDKEILVSDTIVHIGFTSFWDQLDSLYGDRKTSIFPTLDSLDHEREDQQFTLREFKGKKFNGKKPTYVVFFSGFYKNMVIGEIIIQKSNKRALNYDAQTSFTKSLRYLFIFDGKNRLKKVLKTEIAYD